MRANKGIEFEDDATIAAVPLREDRQALISLAIYAVAAGCVAVSFLLEHLA